MPYLEISEAVYEELLRQSTSPVAFWLLGARRRGRETAFLALKCADCMSSRDALQLAASLPGGLALLGVYSWPAPPDREMRAVLQPLLRLPNVTVHGCLRLVYESTPDQTGSLMCECLTSVEAEREPSADADNATLSIVRTPQFCFSHVAAFVAIQETVLVPKHILEVGSMSPDDSPAAQAYVDAVLQHRLTSLAVSLRKAELKVLTTARWREIADDDSEDATSEAVLKPTTATGSATVTRLRLRAPSVPMLVELLPARKPRKPPSASDGRCCAVLAQGSVLVHGLTPSSKHSDAAAVLAESFHRRALAAMLTPHAVTPQLTGLFHNRQESDPVAVPSSATPSTSLNPAPDVTDFGIIFSVDVLGELATIPLQDPSNGNRKETKLQPQTAEPRIVRLPLLMPPTAQAPTEEGVERSLELFVANCAVQQDLLMPTAIYVAPSKASDLSLRANRLRLSTLQQRPRSSSAPASRFVVDIGTVPSRDEEIFAAAYQARVSTSKATSLDRKRHRVRNAALLDRSDSDTSTTSGDSSTSASPPSEESRAYDKVHPLSPQEPAAKTDWILAFTIVVALIGVCIAPLILQFYPHLDIFSFFMVSVTQLSEGELLSPHA